MTTLHDPADLRHPTGGRSSVVDVDGPLHIVDYGGEGPPMVLLHGLGGSHLNWVLAAPLLATVFRVVAIDLPGFGLTPPAGRSADIRDQAGIVARYVSGVVGEPAFLAGNSMGGLIALLVADAAPKSVRGAVLIDPALPPDRIRRPSVDTLRFLAFPLVPVVGMNVAAYRRSSVPVEQYLQRRLEYVAADPSRIPAETNAAFHAMEEAERQMPWAMPTFVDAGRSIAKVLTGRRSFHRMVHRIGPPVLVIHGARDQVVPVDFAKAVAANRPDWRLEIIDDIGHVPPLECPYEMTALVADWYERVVAGRS